MSRYYQNNPDEPIRHDWFAGGRRITGPVVEGIAASGSYDDVDTEIARLEARLKVAQDRMRELFAVIDECEAIRHALAALRVARARRKHRRHV